MHNNDTPYICRFSCSKTFPCKSFRNAHEVRVHVGLPRFLFPLFLRDLSSRQGLPHSKHKKRACSPPKLVENTEENVIVNFLPPFGEFPTISNNSQKKIDEIVNRVASGQPISAPRKAAKARATPTIAQCQYCGLVLK